MHQIWDGVDNGQSNPGFAAFLPCMSIAMPWHGVDQVHSRSDNIAFGRNLISLLQKESSSRVVRTRGQFVARQVKLFARSKGQGTGPG